MSLDITSRLGMARTYVESILMTRNKLPNSVQTSILDRAIKETHLVPHPCVIQKARQ
jgi:hypothetical protein